MKVLLTVNTCIASCRVWRLLLLAVVMSAVCRVAAQNNPYKINDELYKMYMAADARRYHHEGLALADAMYRRAVEKGDRKAQCIARIVPVQYWQFKGNDGEFEKALKALQDISLRNGYLQYFYHGATLKVTYLLRKQQTLKAHEYAEEMFDYASRHKHPFGVFSGFGHMGKIHFARSEYGLAAQAYRSAIDFGNDYLPDQDMSTQYRLLSECYEEIFCYADMLKYSEKGYLMAKSRIAKLRLLVSICRANYMLGNYAEFALRYAELERLFGRIDPRTRDMGEIEVLAMKYLYDRRMDEASDLIASIPDSLYLRHKMLLWMEYSRRDGNYRLLATNQQVFYRGRIVGQDNVRKENVVDMDQRLADISNEYDHQKLVADRQRLVNDQRRADIDNTNLLLANTRLTLRNSSLELQRTRAKADIMRLSYSRKQLEAERMREQIKTSRAQQRLDDTIMAAVYVVCVVLLFAVALYMRSRNRIMDRLRAVHDELESNHAMLAEALDRAEAANRAKSVFISNLGEEIRGPLNSVAQLAGIISDTRCATDPAQLRELNAGIHANTDAMLHIVDTALDRTRMEK